jgi:hypothetical protein
VGVLAAPGHGEVAAMNDWTWAGKLVTEFGVLGLMVFGMVIFYRLADKWAGKFLDAQTGQTKAITEQAAAVTGLATAVKDGAAVSPPVMGPQPEPCGG